jgi:LmbE family N-acetylglucosaminyl deacetylase
MSRAGEILTAIRALPYRTLDEILGNAVPLILAPHPDDEVIGCGGLIAEVTRRQAQPVIVFVTDGSGSHPHSRKFPRIQLIEQRETEARDAAAILGVRPAQLHFMRIRDTAVPHDGDSFAQAVEVIVGIVTSHVPCVIFAPWACDPHGDHVGVHKIAVRAAQETGARHLSYPVWGWTLPDGQELGVVSVAGCRLCVRDHRDVKSRALHAHRSQVSDLIDDDPTGFHLDERTLARMLSDDEVFLVNP